MSGPRLPRGAPGFSLLLVTDRKASPVPLPEAVAAALGAAPPGVAAVQIREKDLGGRALAELARALQPLCRARGAPLFVNDRADVALAVGLSGVHLAGTSISAADARELLGGAAIVGVSCHSRDEVAAAAAAADYATFGPIFDTPSKRAYGPPKGPAALAEAAALGLPLYALGGVRPENVVGITGARGIAALSCGLGAPDPAEAVRRLWAAWSALSGP